MFIDFPQIDNLSLRRAFEKSDLKELKLAIETGIFDAAPYVININKNPSL